MFSLKLIDDASMESMTYNLLEELGKKFIGVRQMQWKHQWMDVHPDLKGKGDGGVSTKLTRSEHEQADLHPKFKRKGRWSDQHRIDAIETRTGGLTA